LVKAGAPAWAGIWAFTGWWATDESGATVEGPEEWEVGSEGGFILYEDGTYEFDGLDFTASGDYTFVDGVLTMEMEDDWWGQPWNVTIDGDEMSMGMGDWPTGEGEGYTLVKTGDAPTPASKVPQLIS